MSDTRYKVYYGVILGIDSGLETILLFFYLVRCPTSYIQAQCTRLHRKLTRGHIASLAAHTTLNIYKPMEINIKRSPEH